MRLKAQGLLLYRDGQPDLVGQVFLHHHQPIEMGMALALQFAAGPEMLDACERALAALERVAPTEPAVGYLVAAISKAGGKS